jgi:Asp-tRNA(Asn)/Glu-tRNA(Gln) amidotransferase A subunit family amidase
VKDNVCVAGVPMMNGSSTLEGYVPNLDATIITRLLDAGATIKGKAHCENWLTASSKKSTQVTRHKAVKTMPYQSESNKVDIFGMDQKIP